MKRLLRISLDTLLTSTLPIIIQGKNEFSKLKNPPDTFFSELILIFECFMSEISI